MQSGIYLITNTITGLIYVGSSKNFSSRRAEHWHKLRREKHQNPHLQAAWNKYGETAFLFSILEHCPEADLAIREDWWLVLLGCTRRGVGYNIRAVQRPVCPPEMRQRMSDAKKGKTPWNKGVPMTAERKEKMAAAHRGKAPWNKGLPASDEHRKRLSEAHRGQVSWNKGMPISEEQKAKQSAAMKGRVPPNKGKKGQVAWNKGLKRGAPVVAILSDL